MKRIAQLFSVPVKGFAGARDLAQAVALSLGAVLIGGGILIGLAQALPDLVVESHNRTQVRVAWTQTQGSLVLEESDDLVAWQEFPVIRRVASGIITTFAGNGGCSPGGDGGLATSASFSFPTRVAADGAGNVYIVDQDAGTAHRVDTVTGIITRVAGDIAPGDIDTIAGTGVPGFSGDGGPALQANLFAPTGVAVAPDGTIYFADTVNNRVRAVSPAGVITTVAGDGQIGNDGDDGPATAARFANVYSLALDPARASLYVSDRDNFRIRRVDLATGLIHAYAGTGARGFSGDGGPALAAELAQDGIATDAAGNLFVADLYNCVVRRVDAATGIITTVAGQSLSCLTAGDGGPATQAAFSAPTRLTVDPAGNLYVVDLDSQLPTVRRIDAATGIISKVAEFPPPPGVVYNLPWALATRADGTLLIADFTRILVRDPATGDLAVLAGGDQPGFAGDGGPAADALFHEILGLAFAPDGTLLVADSGNHRLRAIAPPPGPPSGDVVITADTSQSFLDSLTIITGSLIMVDVDERVALSLPNLTQIGGSLIVTDNDALVSLDLPLLQTVGGRMEISRNPLLDSVQLWSLTSVALGTPEVGVAVTGNAILVSISLGAAETFNGDVTIVQNPSLTNIDLGAAHTFDGDVTIVDNGTLTSIDLGAAETFNGDVAIVQNPSLTNIDIGPAHTFDGNVTIVDNGTLISIDLGAAETFNGDVAIVQNQSLTNIDLGAAQTFDGNVTIVDNGTASISLGSAEIVNGDVTIQSTGSGTLDLSLCASGSSLMTATGYDAVAANTAAEGGTTLTLEEDIVVELDLATGTFADCVPFTVASVAAAPETGTDPDGSPATVLPIAAYQIEFAVPALGIPASLTFEIVLASLDPALRTQVLDALAAGLVTLATKSDDPGASYQAFPICDEGEAPTPDGCVLLERLDAAGQPTAGAPEILRFSNVVGHFSTWAVAIVQAIPYDLWARARGLIEGVNAGLLDDPNHDGCPNIEHFALDTDPLGNGSDEGKRRVFPVDLSGTDYLTITIPIRLGASFSGTPLTSNLVDGLTYLITGDTDLHDPWDLPLAELVPALDAGLPVLGDYDSVPGPDWEYRSFRLTDPFAAHERAFLRVGVTEAP